MTQDSYRTINLFNWTGGIVGRRRNPLRFMESALAAGENVDVADGALRTRPGTSLMSSGSLPAGEVMALENVRFPTNEVSYLVAQVKHSPSPPTWETNTAWEELTSLAFTNPPYAVWTGRIGSSLVWDAGNGRILKFAGGTEGGYTNDLWTYDPETDTWALLYPYTDDAPTVGGPGFRAGHRAVYVPAMEAMVVLGGGSWVPWPDNDYEDAHLHIWDCQTDTWTSQATTGETPLPRNHFVAILRGNTIIIPDCAAYNNLAYYSLDLSTWVWTRHEQAAMTEGTPIGHHHQSGVYDPVNDALIMVGGYYGDSVMSAATFVLDFATKTWTRKADCPVIDTDEVGIIGHQAVYCSGKMLITGDSGYTETYSDPRNPLEAYVYDVASDSWTAHAWDTAFDVPEGEGPLPPRRGDHAMCISDTGETFMWGGNTGTYSDIFHGLWELSGQCSSCDGSTRVNLFASPDHLPTTTGQFESIYEFTSEPGICTFGVLNDRVVITEGIAAPPLVWAGAMADNASDWPHPKAVLIAQDGERFYDVSSEVCDKDPDTVAQVGGIRTWGAIYICTDMPEVEGFYFDMKSPNTGATGTTTSTFHSPMQITEADHVARQDLKGTIVNWVQNSGAAGHFTNAGGDTITVGPGNDRGAWDNGTAYVVGDTVTLNSMVYWCILNHTGHTPPNLTYWRINNPDIVPGIAVDLGDGEFLITAVTHGGYGAAEVSLSDTHANATVNTAYGLSMGTGGLTVNLGYQTGVSSWTKSLSGFVPLAGYSVRVVVPGSEISIGGDHVQLTLKANTTRPAYKTQYAAFIDSLQITHVSIMERSGCTGNGTTVPTEITFPGLYGTHVSGCTFSNIGEEKTSDIIPFTVDETKDYLVTLDVAWSTSWYVPADAGVLATWQTFRAGYLPQGTGQSYIKDYGWGNGGNSWDQQTADGFTLVDAVIWTGQTDCNRNSGSESQCGSGHHNRCSSVDHKHFREHRQHNS